MNWKIKALSAAQQEVAEQQAQVKSLTTALAEQEAHEEGSTDIAVGEVQRQLRKEKERGKQLRRLRCRQASEQEELIAAKDQEIMELRRQLAVATPRMTPRAILYQLKDCYIL